MQFYKQGLPHKLLIQKELKLGLDALLIKIRAEINNAGTAGDREHLNTQYQAQKKKDLRTWVRIVLEGMGSTAAGSVHINKGKGVPNIRGAKRREKNLVWHYA